MYVLHLCIQIGLNRDRPLLLAKSKIDIYENYVQVGGKSAIYMY